MNWKSRSYIMKGNKQRRQDQRLTSGVCRVTQLKRSSLARRRCSRRSASTMSPSDSGSFLLYKLDACAHALGRASW